MYKAICNGFPSFVWENLHRTLSFFGMFNNHIRVSFSGVYMILAIQFITINFLINLNNHTILLSPSLTTCVYAWKMETQK